MFVEPSILGLYISDIHFSEACNRSPVEGCWVLAPDKLGSSQISRILGFELLPRNKSCEQPPALSCIVRSVGSPLFPRSAPPSSPLGQYKSGRNAVMIGLALRVDGETVYIADTSVTSSGAVQACGVGEVGRTCFFFHVFSVF